MTDKRNEDCPLLIHNPTGPKDWRLNRAVLFKWRQLRRRWWIQFHEIVEWYAELNRGSITEEAARASAYDKLQRDLLAGEFEEGGRSQVLFLHPDILKARMTPAWLRTIIERQRRPEEIVREQYLSQCWIPRRMFDWWIARHELPRSPPRFEPRERVEPPPWLSLFEPREPTQDERGESTPPSLEPQSAKRRPGRKSAAKRDAVKAFIAKRYPNNSVPEYVSPKDIAQALKHEGVPVSVSTVQRVMGRRK
jgi:hypothetical protein